MMFLWIPFLLVIPFAMMWLMRSGNGSMGCCGMDHGSAGHTPAPPAPPTAPSTQNPIEIARTRLAKGEITIAEFEEIKRTLG